MRYFDAFVLYLVFPNMLFKQTSFKHMLQTHLLFKPINLTKKIRPVRHLFRKCGGRGQAFLGVQVSKKLCIDPSLCFGVLDTFVHGNHLESNFVGGNHRALRPIEHEWSSSVMRNATDTSNNTAVFLTIEALTKRSPSHLYLKSWSNLLRIYFSFLTLFHPVSRWNSVFQAQCHAKVNFYPLSVKDYIQKRAWRIQYISNED